MSRRYTKYATESFRPMFTGPFAVGVIFVLIYCIDLVVGTRILSSFVTYAKHVCRWIYLSDAQFVKAELFHSVGLERDFLATLLLT